MADPADSAAREAGCRRGSTSSISASSDEAPTTFSIASRSSRIRPDVAGLKTFDESAVNAGKEGRWSVAAT